MTGLYEVLLPTGASFHWKTFVSLEPSAEVEFLFLLLSFSSSSSLLPCHSCFSVGQTAPSLSSFWQPEDSIELSGALQDCGPLPFLRECPASTAV